MDLTRQPIQQLSYVARSILHVTPQGTEKTLTYRPGDVILGFAAWPEASKRALINAGRVEPILPHYSGVPESRSLDAIEAERPFTEPLHNVADQAQEPVVPHGVTVGELAHPEMAEPTEALDPDVVEPVGDAVDADTDVQKCGLCAKEFASMPSLRRHRTRVHPDAEPI